MFVHDLQEIALATDCTMFLTTNTSREDLPRADHGRRADRAQRPDLWLAGRERPSGHQVSRQRLPARAPCLQDHRWRASSSIRASRRCSRIQAARCGGPAGGPRAASPGSMPCWAAALPVASTTMVMGPSGTGKTTMGLHFLSRSSEAEPGLMFGFYETPARMQRQGRAASCRPLARCSTAVRSSCSGRPPTSDLLDAYGQTPDRRRAPTQGEAAVHRRTDELSAEAAVDPSRLGHLLLRALQRAAGAGRHDPLLARGARYSRPRDPRPGRRCLEPGREHDPAALRRAALPALPADLDPQGQRQRLRRPRFTSSTITAKAWRSTTRRPARRASCPAWCLPWIAGAKRRPVPERPDGSQRGF